MDQNLVMTIARESVTLVFLLAGPLVLTGLAVGLIISVIQTTTSIQEQSLSFIPKMVSILVALVIFGRWMLTNMVNFTLRLIERIPELIMYNG
ncbi:flagellar biosynthesis protein FliQ [bacterium]|nr:flagellar biosynthesis protein FliQ [bacterium]